MFDYELPPPDMDRVPDDIYKVMENMYVNKMILNDVLLAGGAPRDLILGGEISDWDFFVHTTLADTITKVNAVDEIMRNTGFGICDPTRSMDPNYSAWTVRDYERGLLKVQVIFSGQRLRDFDISTCQVGIDMTGEWYMTPEFISSWRNRYHTVYMKNYKTRYQLGIGLGRHLPRLLVKYPWNVFIEYRDTTGEQMKQWIDGLPEEIPF